MAESSSRLMFRASRQLALKASVGAFLGASILAIVSCDGRYRVNSDSVSWVHWNEAQGKVVTPLDVERPQSFKVLTRNFGRDSASVFYQSQKIDGADPQTFSVLNETYSRDQRAVYFMWTEVPGADPATIKPLDVNYAVDANSVYLRDSRITGANPDSFDIADFEKSDVYDCYLVADWFGCEKAYTQGE